MVLPANTTMRRIQSYNNGGTEANKIPRKPLRRAPSILSMSSNVGRLLVITQALLFFQMLLVDGSSAAAGLKQDNRERNNNGRSQKSPWRFVRRQIMLTEELEGVDPFGSGDPFAFGAGAPLVNQDDDDDSFGAFNMTDDAFGDSNATLGEEPSASPSTRPSDASETPTGSPTDKPSTSPSHASETPTIKPTQTPSVSPSEATESPTRSPTDKPSTSPSDASETPTLRPTNAPTSEPTSEPSAIPSSFLFPPVNVLENTPDPIGDLQVDPTNAPIGEIDGRLDLSDAPSLQPSRRIKTRNPNAAPNNRLTHIPTFFSTPAPLPTPGPTPAPTPVPSPGPTFTPTQ